MTKRIFLMLAAVLPPLAAQSLDDLVDEVLLQNREIVAAQKKYEAAKLRPAQTSSLPDPTVSAGYTANGGPWPVAGIGHSPTSSAGLAISQEMPFPGKRKLRGDIAEREADAEYRDYLAVRLSVVSRLKQAYHQLHHAVVAARFVRQDQQILRDILRITEARYASGHAAQQDIFKAQAQYAVFEAQLARYEQEQKTEEATLNALLNRPAGGHIQVPEEMAPGELRFSLADLLAGTRTHSPVIGRGQKLIERAELETNLARKEMYPDYTISGGYFNQGGLPPMWQFRVDFKVPAYFWRKQRLGIEEQEASLGEARRSYESSVRTVEAAIQEEYFAATTARRLVDLYRQAVVPEAKLALESSLASYEAGAVDFLAVFTNFMTVVDYELMNHEEIMRFHVAMARLEELSGMEVEP